MRVGTSFDTTAVGIVGSNAAASLSVTHFMTASFVLVGETILALET